MSKKRVLWCGAGAIGVLVAALMLVGSGGAEAPAAPAAAGGTAESGAEPAAFLNANWDLEVRPAATERRRAGSGSRSGGAVPEAFRRLKGVEFAFAGNDDEGDKGDKGGSR